MCILRPHPQEKQTKLLAWAALFSGPLGKTTAASCVSGSTCLAKTLIHLASGSGPQLQDHWGPFGTKQVKSLVTVMMSIHISNTSNLLMNVAPYHSDGSGLTSLWLKGSCGQQSFHIKNVPFALSNAGQQGDIWRRAEIPLVSAVNYQVVIEGTSGPGYQGDIALDDISFTPNCRPDTGATISPIPPSGTPPPGCKSGQYRYVGCQISLIWPSKPLQC